jgi:hypothetical protein
MSAVLKEIQQWSATQPAWQQEAAVRLFERGQLTSADDADLFALLLSVHGIPDPNGRTPRAFSADLVAPDQPPGKVVQLGSMSPLRHVNALADGAKLTFGSTGLTAIYGDNGTGKSGYARVLKKACRARDQKEAIHPNANHPAAKAGPAEVAFEVWVDGVAVTVQWKDGDTPPDALATLAVFDAWCARAYVDEQGDYAYSPYGMDILHGLGTACTRLRSLLEAEQRRTVVNSSSYAGLGGQSHDVSRFVDRLSHASSLDELERLSTLSPDEMDERVTLAKALSEENPADKARQLRQRAGRLSELMNRCTQRLEVVAEKPLGDLRQMVAVSNTAKAAAALAAQDFKERSGLLPGTGGEAWGTLFEAARKFAAEAYPSKTFPELGAESPCPLCQQPLGESAERLRVFDGYIRAEAEKEARRAREVAGTAFVRLRDASVDLGLTEALRMELAELDPGLPDRLVDVQKALGARKTAAEQACGGKHEWDALPPLPDSPVSALSALVDGVITEAIAHEGASDATALAGLKARRSLLDARAQLGLVKASVVEAVNTMKRIRFLGACANDIRPLPVTLKAKELNEKIITENLGKALNAEFAALGVQGLQVSLRPVGNRGKMEHKLVLEKAGQQRVGDILSEGEQRAIALASFLADVGLSGSTAGLIFDDPVSSLDHLRRGRVVGRLVAEAKNRQVIVFTHDLYFLTLVQEDAKQAGVDLHVRSLQRTPEGYGVPEDSLPFAGANTGARVGLLRQAQVRAAKLLKLGDESGSAKLVQDIYVDLRKAWERGVEEVLFNGTVSRFSAAVETNRLAAVEVTDDDFRAVRESMARCSKFAHDGAAAAYVAMPTPDELTQDIDKLEAWRTQTEKRRDRIRRARS